VRRLRARLSGRDAALAVLAPVSAVAIALLISSVVILIAGHHPIDAYRAMAKSLDPSTPRGDRYFVLIVNQATTYYLAGVAVAIAFRMNLFNIGVDGQYRLAVMVAALVGAQVDLPPFLQVPLILVIAMLVGGLWASIAGLLKVGRGISEVISTIMLNAIATAVVAYLLNRFGVTQGNDRSTEELPRSAWIPGIPWREAANEIYGLVFLAVIVGILYGVLLGRTRFGFDLRATGLSQSAAVASGVSVKAMTLRVMFLSGATAGLVGLPLLLGNSHSYGLDFPAGVGFVGIAIALLGRNSAVGMAFAALLWGFLDSSAVSLETVDVPKELVRIMQGVLVLSVVVAYELVRRYRLVLEQRDVGRAVGEPPPGPGGPAAPSLEKASA
jgi:ABC-type uncharacterized transport system permease subunit